METEVPEIKPKDQRIKAPEKKNFDDQMKKLGNDIEKLKKQRQDLIYKKREFIEGGTVGNT
jgi:hypothetical protein